MSVHLRYKVRKELPSLELTVFPGASRIFSPEFVFISLVSCENPGAPRLCHRPPPLTLFSVSRFTDTELGLCSTSL